VKTVAFFNHKGGVGKTTIVFNVALALAELGKPVLLVDADAQANLTALALDEAALEGAIEAEGTVWSAVSPLVSGAGDLKTVQAIQVRPRVTIIPGDIRLSNFEAICPQGWTESLAGQERGFRVTSAMFRLVEAVAEEVEAELVFMDLGPNVNALNRTVMLASDGFVVPMAPDLFSVRALPSVGMSTARWVAEWRIAKQTLEQDLSFPIPRGDPKPLGYISQQFTVYRRQPSGAYQKWLERIPQAYEEGILRPLHAVGITPPPGQDPSLGTLPNFFSLTPIAQDNNKAVFELSGAEARGAQFTRAQETRARFIELAREVIDRIGADQP
jgi:chromosome partitioning protein